MDAAKRVAMNTGILYGRMLITMFISLYSTRLILNALGANDFGIFNLVGGVIAMLAFLNDAMAVSTQRYMSYYLGANEKTKLSFIFQSSVLLHLIIGFVIVIILEVLGIFLFDGILNIPEGRIVSAKIVYHFMVVSTFFTINAVPYDATINSHENMLIIALTGIFEAFMKLGIALWLVHTSSNKLVLYGLLVALLTIIIRLIKSVYCSRNYEECKLPKMTKLNTSFLKEMFSFAGWNLFGSSCMVVRNQGLPIILNMFFGVIVNAAYGIANQINFQLTTFSTFMLKAMGPQIAKSEGGGNRERMIKISLFACKISFIMLALFAIPLIIEMNYVLELWLKEVPEYTLVFCKLILVISLIQQLTMGLMRAIQSTGNIKAYQSAVGTTILLNLPLAFILIKMDYDAHVVLIGAIAIEILAMIVRIYFTKRLTGMSASMFLMKVVLNSITAVLIAGLAAIIPYIFMSEGILRLGVVVCVSSVALIISSRYIVLSVEEFNKIKVIILDVFDIVKVRIKTTKY